MNTRPSTLVPQEQRNSPRAAKKQYPRNISRKPCVLSAGIASGRGSALLIQLCLLAHAGLLQLCSGTIDPLPLHTPADQGGISTSSKINVQQQQEQGGAVRSLGDVETESGTGAGGRNGVLPVPRVPFCRTGANVANMWMPVWDSGNQVMETAKRVVVSGGKGVDYYHRRADGELSYLSDVWALHITNTGFRWNKVTLQGKVQPSPRWQTGNGVAYDRSLVIYGGDDQTTNEVGGLGDLWVYTPRSSRSTSHLHDWSQEDEWKSYDRGGDDHPGERREPSLTMINSTLLLQGGRVVDGNSHELCDSRLFLLDLADPKGEWREGASLPGDCALGQTMDTVTLPGEGGDKVRAVVFGGCQLNPSGTFSCSNDIYAYDLGRDVWEQVKPKSDMDAHGCPSAPNITPPGGPGALDGNLTRIPNDTTTTATSSGENAEKSSQPAECPGISTPRPLGRRAHASAYIMSKVDYVNALFIFGGRESTDDLTPLGDLWMFDFQEMRWSEITPDSKKKAPVNRFSHSLTVWAGGAGDGVASLVVFGGETINSQGQTTYLNDVWLYTPHTGAWREVSRSECQEGATGVVRGGNWTALIALVTLLTLVVVVQCLLHNICPHYEPPKRRRRRRRKSEDSRSMPTSMRLGHGSLMGDAENGGRRGSVPPIAESLLFSGKPQYNTLDT